MKTIRPQALEAIFGSVPHLNAKDLRAIYRRVQKLHLRRGDILLRKGDKAEALFFALTGRFSVILEAGARPVAEIGSGAPIGEIAFFAGGTRTATVVALRDALVLKLRRPEFEELSDLIPNLAKWLIQALSQRLRDTIFRLPDGSHFTAPRTIAIVPAGGGPVPERFLYLLESVFQAAGKSVLLRESMVRERFSAERSLEDPSITAWLNAHEENNRFVLYAGDRSLTEWTRKAVRQADLVLLVGRAETDNRINAIERFVDAHHSQDQKRLVLVHEARSNEAEGTGRWLATRAVAMHHHVALGDAIDVARLQRFIEGTATGFVCCGGGSYCALHVGIYKAFCESGMEFDIFGGASGGGAMAAGFARGLAPEEIDARIEEIFIKRQSLRRVNFPYYSILDHKPFDAALQDHYGAHLIEDLWRPFFALATNLSDATPHIIKTGPLWEAVRATSSIPGLLPPFITRDGLPLVDGSVIDNVPLEEMKRLKSGPNVVVNFTDRLPASLPRDYDNLPSRAELVLHHILPFGERILPNLPTIATTIIRSMMASQKELVNLTDLDLVLTPPLPMDMSFMDWRSHSRLLTDGYVFASAEIQRLVRDKHPVLQALGAISQGNASHREQGMEVSPACEGSRSEASLQASENPTDQSPAE